MCLNCSLKCFGCRTRLNPFTYSHKQTPTHVRKHYCLECYYKGKHLPKEDQQRISDIDKLNLSIEEKFKIKLKAISEHEAIMYDNRKRKAEGNVTTSICKKHNITISEYNFKLKQQKYRCAVCGHKETAKTSKGHLKRLSLDHNHITGQVRGLLCVKCNIAMGLIRDDLTILDRMRKYLFIYNAVLKKQDHSVKVEDFCNNILFIDHYTDQEIEYNNYILKMGSRIM